jgi:hypothetical protein
MVGHIGNDYASFAWHIAVIGIQEGKLLIRDGWNCHQLLALKLEQLEYRLGKHDDEIATLFEAIKQLMLPTVSPKKRRIGF